MKAIVALSAKGRSTTENGIWGRKDIETTKIFRSSQIGLPFQKCTCYCKTKYTINWL
jgi:hypothetical protein